MKLTNDSYTVFLETNNFSERYFKDAKGWIKISAKGRKFRMTAEQVLNHLLPAIARIKPGLVYRVDYRQETKPSKSKK